MEVLDGGRLQINVGEKFACFAFANFGLAREVPDEVGLGESVWAGRRLPVNELERHWQQWLGSVTLDPLRRTNFVLLNTVTSQHPEVLDGENQELTATINHIFYALVLQGSPHYDSGFSLSGANVGGELQVRQFSKLKDYEPSYDMPPFRVGIGELARAFFLSNPLRRVNREGPDWARFRRGLKALFSGCLEKDGGERLHQFVRALEALLKPEVAKTRAQFGHRAQSFAVANDETRNTLLQIFDMRSNVEHVHSPLNGLQGTEEERLALANRRVRQVDRLCRFAFTRVLESEALLETFRTEANTDVFWAMRDNERVATWGERMDLTAVG